MKIRISLVSGSELKLDGPKSDKNEFTSWLKGRLEDRFSQYLELPGGAILKKSEIAMIAVI